MNTDTDTDTDTDTVTVTTTLATAVYEAAHAAPASGTIYLLHFDRPYRHAAHYTGWTRDLDNRLAQHATGRGARLLQIAAAFGIGWYLARTWPGTRATERALKRQGGASRRCPACGVQPRTPSGGTP